MVKIDRTEAYLDDYVRVPKRADFRRSLVWHQREFRFPPAKLPLFARLAVPLRLRTPFYLRRRWRMMTEHAHSAGRGGHGTQAKQGLF